MDDSKTKKRKQVVYRTFAAVLSAVFILSAINLIGKAVDSRDNRKTYTSAIQIAGITKPAELPERDTMVPDAPWQESEQERMTLSEEAAYLAAVDMDALRAVNSDVVGWIEIPGTALSYPLMQGTDNQYYLNYTWQRDGNSGGSIFVDYRCSPALTDFHTIVYGHRMRNESMFGMLKYYADINYWREHPSVYIVTGGTIRRYDIFAAWESTVNGEVYVLNFPGERSRSEFLDMAIERSAISTGITPTSLDLILTLSTCSGNGYSTRWVVQSVLVEVYSIDSLK